DTESIVKVIRQAVSAYHELQAYAVVLIKAGTISKTSSGKIQRHACREAFLVESLEVIESNILQQIEIYCVGSNDTFNRDALLDLEPQQRQSMLEAHLLERVARILRISPSRLNHHQSLSTLGLDSLMAIELKNDIETNLDLILPLVSLLQGPDIEQLTAQILEQLEASEDDNEFDRSMIPLIAGGEQINEGHLSHGQGALWFLQQM